VTFIVHFLIKGDWKIGRERRLCWRAQIEGCAAGSKLIDQNPGHQAAIKVQASVPFQGRKPVSSACRHGVNLAGKYVGFVNLPGLSAHRWQWPAVLTGSASKSEKRYNALFAQFQ
jgi:hypothetical protein